VEFPADATRYCRQFPKRDLKNSRSHQSIIYPIRPI
jgi:hypothetical protein